jgi:hypothetical protein
MPILEEKQRGEISHYEAKVRDFKRKCTPSLPK